MALSSATVPTVETAALATDAPLFVATHVVDTEAVGSRIRANTSGTMSDPDASLAASPSYYAVDRSGLRPAVAGSAAATWYFGLRAITSSIEIDCCYLGNHNLDTANLTVTLQRSDVIAFTSPTTIHSFGTVNPGRHFAPFAVRVTGTGYLRLVVQIGSGTFTPSIGEIWIGRRRQLNAVPKLSVDYAARRSARAASGTISRDGLVLHTQRGVVTAQWTARDAEATLRDRDTIAAVWSESQGGRWPVLFVPRPSSAPHEAQIMRLQAPAYDITRDDFGSRGWGLDMLEQAPFLRSA